MKRSRAEFEGADYAGHPFYPTPTLALAGYDQQCPSMCFEYDRPAKRRKKYHDATQWSLPVSVVTLTGTTYHIHVEPTDSIADLKGYIEELSGVAASQQRIVYRGKVTADHLTVGHYQIQPGSNLHLVMALRGGL